MGGKGQSQMPPNCARVISRHVIMGSNSLYRSLAKRRGVTLVEMIVVLAILAILATVAVPAFDFINNRRLNGATDSIHSLIQYARSEANARSRPIYVAAVGGADWCIGISEKVGCNCTLATGGEGACALTDAISGQKVLKRLSAGEFTGVQMTQAPSGLVFEPVRGTVNPAGAIHLQSAAGRETRISITITGRTSVCSPTGGTSIAGYGKC